MVKSCKRLPDKNLHTNGKVVSQTLKEFGRSIATDPGDLEGTGGQKVVNRFLSTSVRICGDVLLYALRDAILLSLAWGEACSDAKKKPFLSDSRRRRTATPGVLGAPVYVTLL
jgi:hypothetical protein